MNNWQDSVTSLLQRVFDILLARNPVMTSMGACFGLILHGAVFLFAPTILALAPVNLSALAVWHFVAIGVFLFNIPQLLRSNRFDPSIEDAMALIEAQRKAKNISKAEAQALYRQLVRKVVRSVELNPELDAKVEEVEASPQRSVAKNLD